MTTKSPYQREIEDRLVKALQTKIELNVLFLQAVTKEDWNNAGAYQDAMEVKDKVQEYQAALKEFKTAMGEQAFEEFMENGRRMFS